MADRQAGRLDWRTDWKVGRQADGGGKADSKVGRKTERYGGTQQTGRQSGRLAGIGRHSVMQEGWQEG